MDQGINLPFNSVGYDDMTFGLPVFADGWKGLIITGSSQKALSQNNGGRLILNIKCAMDPSGQDNGKEHLIGLNLWHNDKDVAKRAETELAAIMRAIFGSDRQINSTAELYNQPFMAKAVVQTSAPSPQYPNPQPQTNWRGYATKDGLGIGVEGPNGKLGGGNGGGFGGGQQPPAGGNQPQQGNGFGQNNGGGQPQQGNGFGNNGNQPQQNGGGNNGGGWGNGGGNQPQQDNNQNNGGGFGQNNGGNNGGAQNNGGHNAQNGGNGGGWGNGGGNNAGNNGNGGQNGGGFGQNNGNNGGGQNGGGWGNNGGGNNGGGGWG